MLIHPTMGLLAELGLHGMAKGFQELQAQPESRALEHADWLALLLERESTTRRQKRFENRARAAALRHNASIEDVDFKASRGLDRGLFLSLAGGDWIRQHRSLLITGPASLITSLRTGVDGCAASAMPISTPIDVPTQCTCSTSRRAISVTMSAMYCGWP